MKKISFFGVIFCSIVLMFNSCNKDTVSISDASSSNVSIYDEIVTIESIESMLNQIYSNSDNRLKDGWLRRAWDWLVDHTGVSAYFVPGVGVVDCGFNLPCGPCPGMCLFSGTIDGTPTGVDTTSAQNKALGYSTFGLWLIQNENTMEEAIMFVFNEDVDNYVYHDEFHVSDNVYLSDTLANIIGKSEVLIHKGVYPIVFHSGSGYTYTVVNSTITD